MIRSFSRRFKDERGIVTVIEKDDLPFEVKRIFYISNVPVGKTRAGHAHKTCEQAIIAISGGFFARVEGIDKDLRDSYLLNSNDKYLYVPNGIRVTLYSFSSKAVCLVLCSEKYDEDDYIQ